MNSVRSLQINEDQSKALKLCGYSHRSSRPGNTYPAPVTTRESNCVDDSTVRFVINGKRRSCAWFASWPIFQEYTVDGIAILNFIAEGAATAASTGEQLRAKVKLSVRTPRTSSSSMTVSVSRHVPGWPRKKSDKTRCAVGTMKLTLSARAPATAANTGVRRLNEMRDPPCE